MKILFVMDEYFAANNGLSISSQRFAAELRALGHDVRVLAGDRSGTPDFPLPEYRMPVFDGLIKHQGMSFAEADRAAKLIPEELGMTLSKAFEIEKRLQELSDEDVRYAKLFEYARLLEGMNRQPGMHAAGVVIGDKPLWE